MPSTRTTAALAAALAAITLLASCGKPQAEADAKKAEQVAAEARAKAEADAKAAEAAAKDAAKEAEAFALAAEAYVYGYPLVTMEMTRRVMTNVEKPAGSRAPMGQFVRLREYPTAAYRDVTAPNADTLYTTAWFDVSKEPWIISVPDMKGRYFLLPMLDGWTDVFQVPGKRTTGTKAQTFAITGPGRLPGSRRSPCLAQCCAHLSRQPPPPHRAAIARACGCLWCARPFPACPAHSG